MRVYLDVCCLSRPFDDQTQDRIRLEAEAVRAILARVEAGEFTWISSEAVDFEVLRDASQERREKVFGLTTGVREYVRVSPAITARARSLITAGFGTLDALHLAVAEAARCAILFTTDDRFVRRAMRLSQRSRVQVVNPAAWMLELDDGS